MTSSTIQAAELAAPKHVPTGVLTTARRVVAERVDAFRTRRALERAAAIVGPHEWARMQGDFHQV